MVTTAAGTIAMARVVNRRSHGGSRMLRKAVHHRLAGQRRRHRRVQAAAEQRRGEQRGCRRAAHGPGEAVAAGLRQLAPGGDAEPGAQGLEQDRHEAREQGDGEERVAELGAAGERGRPVARVHVADGDEVARPEEREHPADAESGRDADRAVDVGQRRIATLAPPSGRRRPGGVGGGGLRPG
jgi:hypothetical protein